MPIPLTMSFGQRRFIARPLASLGILLVTAGLPASGDDLLPGIIGEDDRVLLEQQGPPWDAVGQVNIGGYRTSGQCTGTLVAPDVVITAAHCVVNSATGRAFPLNDIHFLAGVRSSENKGHSTAECLHFPEGYPLADPSETVASPAGGKVPLSALAKDAAVIVLNDALDVGPALLAETIVPAPGLDLTHVAYPGDRRFLPVVHRDCTLLRVDPGSPFWLNHCDTHPGSSGGPVFVREGATYKVAAIQVAAGTGGANVALPLSEWASLTEKVNCP